MAIKAHLSHRVDAIAAPVGRGLARLGLSANGLTTMGVVLTGIAGWLVVSGRWFIAGVVLGFGGLADTFDGALARARGTSGPFGGFYDSVSDRISDGVILGAIAWTVRDDALLFGLTVAALVGGLVTSYARAKAESLDADCSVGLLERGERAILLIAALLLPFAFEAVLWIIALGAAITAVQRIVHVHGQLIRRPPVPAGGRPVADRIDGDGGHP